LAGVDWCNKIESGLDVHVILSSRGKNFGNGVLIAEERRIMLGKYGASGDDCGVGNRGKGRDGREGDGGCFVSKHFFVGLKK